MLGGVLARFVPAELAPGFAASRAWMLNEQENGGCALAAADLAAAPSSGLLHYRRGRALARFGRLDEACASMERVLALVPGQPDPQRTLAIIDGLRSVPAG